MGASLRQPFLLTFRILTHIKKVAGGDLFYMLANQFGMINLGNSNRAS